jgi:hypothetical protein
VEPVWPAKLFVQVTSTTSPTQALGKVAVCPLKDILGLRAITEFTVIFWLNVPIQPLALVPVTEKLVLEGGDLVIAAVVAPVLHK